MLTTGFDSFAAGSGDDTFIADSTADAVSTVADSLNGGDGVDTLKLYVDDTNAIVLPGTLTSIEAVEVHESGMWDEAEDFSVAAKTGVTSITLEGASTDPDTTADAHFVLTVGAGQTIVLDTVKDGLDADTANEEGELGIGSAAAVTSINMIVDTVGASSTTGSATGDLDIDIEGTGVTSMALATTVGASYIDLTNTGAKLATLTITGDKALTMASALPTTLKTIDASAATAAVSLVVGYGVTTSTKALKVTMGSGDDKVGVQGILGAADTVSVGAEILIDGGDGFDTIAIDEDFDTAVDTDTEIINFEAVELNGDDAFDLDGLDWVQMFKINADIGNEIIDNIRDDVAINIIADVTDVTLVHANATRAGTQSMSVTIGKASTDLTVGTLSIDGIENITINSVLGSTDGNAVTAMENDAARVLTITGTEDLNITPESVGAEVDAAEFSGDLVIDLTAQAAAILITTGSGDNTITVDADDDNAHEIVLGAGSNTIDVNNENSVYVDATANMMTITGFKGGDGGDVLNLEDTVGVATTAELALIQAAVDEALAADAGLTLTEAAEAAVDAYAAAGNDLYWFEFDGNTYVVYEDGGDADAFDIDADFIIKLVGTDLGLVAAENLVY